MNKSLSPILSLTLVNTLGFSLLIPVLPFMLRNWQLPDWSFGVLLSIYSFCQFWASPIFGQLSDEQGRRKLLIWSHSGTLLAWLFLGLLWFIDNALAEPTFWLVILLAFSRMVDGITGGNNAVTQAYMSDVTDKQNKTTYFGYISAAMGVGMIIGPAIGAYTMATEITYLATAIVGASLSFVTLLFLIFGLPESLKKPKTKSPIQWFAPFKLLTAFRSLSGKPVIQNIFVVMLFLTAVMGAYTSVMVFYLIDQYQFNETQIGHFLFFVGGFAIFNQLVMIKPIVKIFGEAKALAVAMFLLCLGLACFPLITHVWVLVCVYYLVNLGFSVALPTMKGVVSNQTEDNEQGKILGLLESISALMFGIMPIVSTLVYAQISIQSFWVWSLLGGFGVLFLILRCAAVLQSNPDELITHQ